MADVVEKRLNLVVTSENEAEAGLRAVEGLLNNLVRSAETLTSAFRSIIPSVREAETAFRVFGETASGAVLGVREAVATVNNTAWEQLARGAANVAREITEEFQAAGRAIRESLSVGTVTAEVQRPVGGGTSGVGQGRQGGGGIFSYEGSMNLFYGAMSTASIAAPLVAGIKEAVQSYLQFEQAAAQVNTMLHLNQDQFKQLQQQLMALSQEVPQTAEELANGLYGIVGAGVDAADAMDVLRVTAEAAAAGQTDMDTATRALIAVMDAYGMKASEVGKISDILFAANQAGVMTFRDLAASIGTVVGPAANAGVSFEEVAAATAALTNTGLSAQRATEGLRALIMGIVSPSKEAQKEAQKLGIEWDVAALKAKGLAGMIEEAMRATGGNTEELKKLIPNIAAYTAAVNLGGKGAEAFRNALEQVRNSAGATDRAMDAIRQTASFQFQEFRKEAEHLGQTFAVAVLPTLVNLMHHLESLMNWFKNLNPTVRDIIAQFLLWSAVILAGVTPILMFLSSIGQIAIVMREFNVIPRVIGFLESLGGAFLRILSVVRLVGMGIVGVIRTITVALMSNPIVLVITAIAVAIGVIVYLIIRHWSQIRDFTVNTWNAIRERTAAIWNSIVTFFATLPGRILGFLSQLPLMIVQLFGFLVGIVVLGSVQIVTAIVTWFSQLPGRAVEFFTGVYNAVTTWMSNAAQSVAQWASNAYHGFVNWIVQLPGRAVEAFWAVVNAVINWGVSMYNHAVQIGSNFINGAVQWLSQLPGRFYGWLQEVINTIASFPGRLYQWGVNLVRSFIDGIRAFAGNIKDAFIQGFENARRVIEGHSPPIEGPFKDIDKWGANVARAYVDGILSQRRAMVAAMRDLVQAGASVAMVNRPAFAFAGGGGGASPTINGGNLQQIHIENLNLPLQPAPDDPKGFAQRLAWSLKTMGR